MKCLPEGVEVRLSVYKVGLEGGQVEVPALGKTVSCSSSANLGPFPGNQAYLAQAQITAFNCNYCILKDRFQVGPRGLVESVPETHPLAVVLLFVLLLMVLWRR